MENNNINIWIWLQNNKLVKAILNKVEGTIRIYDGDDNLILKRTGLNKFQIKQIETCIIKFGAKKLDKQSEPFKFL